MRAVLDVGTNSVRLLLAHVRLGRVEPILREVRVTRLGQGVDASGELRDDAMERTLHALEELMGLIPPKTPTSILATSAVRDAKNKGEFARLVQARLGLSLEILSGLEEAELSFSGALASLEGYELFDPITVVDIGGGSTEIYSGHVGGELLGGGSAQIGAVRLLERFGGSRLPLPEEIRNILLPVVEENLTFQPKTLVAVGGTAQSLAAIMQELPVYSDEKVLGYTFSLGELEDCYGRLGRLSLEERRQIPSLQPGREDVIIYGAAILLQVARLLNFAKIVVSSGDLLVARIARD